MVRVLHAISPAESALTDIDVVQSYRAYEYARNHNMVLVQILQGDLSRPFRNEVMATYG